MFETEIKICGLSTKQAIDAVIDAGAHHTGFIYFEKSPRNISLELSKELSKHIGERISKVAVTVNASDVFLDDIVECLEPNIIQLHGSESIERTREVKARYGLSVMKAFAISTAEQLEATKQYAEVANRLLFDAKAPKGSDLPGGNGVSFDWKLLKNYTGPKDFMLSGGLDETNILQALDISQATSVDISSGVESAPGVKDIAKIESFIKTIKGYDESRSKLAN